MPALWIYSPNALLTKALLEHVAALGYEARSEASGADLAIIDLCAQQSPFLPPPMPTLAVVCTSSPQHLAQLLQLGCRGYLRPADPPEHFRDAVETLLNGGLWADPEVIEEAGEPLETPRLTNRELQVISLLILGLSNKRIAKRLNITEKTVKVHVSAILKKYQAKSRLEVVLRHPYSDTRQG